MRQASFLALYTNSTRELTPQGIVLPGGGALDRRASTRRRPAPYKRAFL